MNAGRLPITFQHIASRDQVHTTIPRSIAARSPERLLRLHRKDPALWRIVGRPTPNRLGDGSRRVSGCIGIINNTAWPDCIGGGELVWKALGQHMQTRGFDVHFFSWSRATYGKSRLAPVGEIATKTVAGMHYHYIPARTVVGYVSQWARRVHPSMLWASFGFDLGINVGLTALTDLAPLFVFQQFWQGMETDGYSIPDTTELLPEWDGVFDAPHSLMANSEFTADRLGHVTGRDVDVILPPTEDALGKSSLDGPVIMVGQGYEKGVDLFQRVADHYPDTEFILIGDAVAKHSDNCRSIGWADPRKYYTTARALLAPSLVTETYGMAVEEARKWGIPTIVSDNGALRDHCEYALSTSDLGAWIDATGAAIRGDVAVVGPTLSKSAALRRFDTAMQRASTVHGGTSMERRTFPTIATYAGVEHTSVGYLHRAMIDVFGLTDYPGGDLGPDVKYVLLHSWSQGQADMFAEIMAKGVHPYACLHSPLAQGELDGEDNVFEQVLQLGPSHVLCGHAPMATVFGYRWLPVPIRVEPLEELRRGPRSPDDTLRIGMWNTWSRRKMKWVQMAACRELARISGRAVELHGPFKPDALHSAIAGGVSILETEFAPQGEYYAHMGGMDLNLQVTVGESFNYTAMESYLLGAPCLVGPGTPAGMFGMEASFVVDDPGDPILVAQMAWQAIQDSAEPWHHERMIKGAEALVDYRHNALQDTLTAIERGDV